MSSGEEVMKTLIKYVSNTLEIYSVIVCPDHQVGDHVEDGYGIYDYPGGGEDISSRTHYGKAVPKESLPYTSSVNGQTVTLKGLPLGTLVETEGIIVEADSEPTEISFDLPGTYSIKLSGSVPHLDETLEVEISG